jgi:5'-nucleotidase (lipoprotein e(P4) family)
MPTPTLARVVLASTLLLPVACDDGSGGHHGGGIGDAGKADGTAVTAELISMIEPGTPVDGVLPNKTAKLGYIFFASEGTSVDLEITHAGSASKLDTVVTIYGARTAAGGWAETIASDDDSGYGALSRLRDVTIEQEGFYLAEVAVASRSAEITNKAFRLALDCTGTCESTGPVAPQGLEIKWSTRAAEHKAASIMAFGVAGQRLQAMADANALPETWAIISDADETILDNSQYQVERAELGTGFGPTSWSKWVARKEATAMPGSVAFLQLVHELGGQFVIVTNRSATECAATQENLTAVGLEFDRILCKDASSDKNPRFQAVEAGDAMHPAVDVVLFVGDNILDFPALTQEIRHQGEDAFADFSERFVIVPNPMYGSWTNNAD